MSSDTLVRAFPDNDNAITNAFFTSTDVTEKTWGSAKLLAESDDVTFWTVMANHPKVGTALTHLITAADLAHSSSNPAQRRAVRKDNEKSVDVILIRLATTTHLCTIERLVHPADLARRVETVLPVSSLFPAATLLFRKSGATAAVVLSSLFMLNPAYLCRLSLFFTNTFDRINRLAVRCQQDMQRGRYQRMSGDVLPFFEQTYRTVKHFWALLQSAPFIADYIPVSRTLRAMRVVADIIAPILQHFLMTCEGLNSRRDVLTRANSMTVNMAVNVSCVIVLYHTYHRPGTQRAWVLPQLVRNTSEALRGFISQYVQGSPEILLDSIGRGKNIHDLMRQLSPLLEDEEDGQIGKVLLALFAPLTDSTDFADLLLNTRERFGEVVLLELVKQGLRMTELLSQKFITADEGKKLGASEDIIARTMAGLPANDSEASPAAASSTPPEPDTAVQVQAAADDVPNDPLVSMVAEVFPHFNRRGIRACLNYYNNDPEQFILDASMENLPPHLLSQLTASSSEEAAVRAQVPPAVAAADALADGPTGTKAKKASHLSAQDFESVGQQADLLLLLGRDLYETLTGSDTDDEQEAGSDSSAADYPQDYASYRKEDGNNYGDDFSGTQFNAVDDAMRDKIRMLTQMMYEDEFDDGQGEDFHAANAGTDTDEDGEGAAGEYPDANGGRRRAGGRGREAVAFGETVTEQQADADGATTSGGAPGGVPGQRPAPRSDYEKKQFRAKVARERTQRIKEHNKEKDDHAPAYDKKQKTSRKQKGGSSGGKSALTKAYQKGAL